MTIISWIFIKIFEVISFLFNHIIKGIGSLIQQLTIKIGMILGGFALISYVAANV